MKLIGKVRVGSKVRKVYEKIPQKPLPELLESPGLSDEVKAEPKQRFTRYNPVLLQQQAHRSVNAFMSVYERKSLRTKGPMPAAHK
jgi:hypothetical protein